MSTITTACRRCHIRKIKCDSNKPACRPCAEAHVTCQPHVRQRRVTSRRPEDESARHRLVWLEDGLLRHLNVDIRNIKTGADLGRYLARTSPSQPNVSTPSSASAPTGLQEYEKDEFPECSGGVRSTGVPADSDESEDDLAPDISLLTLNATGETRYLGPSSGSFFAKYASDFARSFATDGKDGFMNYRSTASYEPGDHALTAEPSPPPRISETLTPTVARYLIHCYYKWVHPLYPVIHASFRRGVVDPICAAPLTETIAIAKKDESEKSHLIMYYLMLALGAVHATAPHEDRIHNAGHVEYQELFSSKKLQPSILFMEALEWLDSLSIVLTLPLRIHIIQILLLICIYGGYRPSGNRHWQLAGIAIRISVEIGLHRHRDSWRFGKPELDRRRRVFWTAYAIEMTAAFNLGRPPSISDEHIDTPFPEESPDILLGLHIIRHRRIQSRILNQMYCAPERFKSVSEHDKHRVLDTLQSELDQWRDELYTLYPRSTCAYPIEFFEGHYYSTMTALHRPTPLFPQPSISSAVTCLRSAGGDIDVLHRLIKSASVATSWMAVQAILLSGITLMVTARVNAAALIQRSDFSVFELMEWSRKCSLVLTIVSERWSDRSISALEGKFSLLANDTLKRILGIQQAAAAAPARQQQVDYPQNQNQNQNQNQAVDVDADGNAMGTLPDYPASATGETASPSQWPYQFPNLTSDLSPSGNGFPNQPSQTQGASGPSGSSGPSGRIMTSHGDIIQGSLSGFGFADGDAMPMENFFGGDELFNFWDPFPGVGPGGMDHDGGGGMGLGGYL